MRSRNGRGLWENPNWEKLYWFVATFDANANGYEISEGVEMREGSIHLAVLHFQLEVVEPKPEDYLYESEDGNAGEESLCR